MAFFVYILKCNDQSYYVGHTDNIEERIAQHHVGNYCEYTTRRRPFEVVFCQDFASRGEALEMEIRIKNWSRIKKEALINQNWELLVSSSKKKFK
jgi:predicted GIY-YIG superfamily endonuclease